MKDGENFCRRAAFLELGGEGMPLKIFFSALFVGIQRIIKDYLEIGWRGGGGELRVRHDGGSAPRGICSCGGEDDSRYLGDMGTERSRRNTLDTALPRVHACVRSIPRNVRLFDVLTVTVPRDWSPQTG